MISMLYSNFLIRTFILFLNSCNYNFIISKYKSLTFVKWLQTIPIKPRWGFKIYRQLHFLQNLKVRKVGISYSYIKLFIYRGFSFSKQRSMCISSKLRNCYDLAFKRFSYGSQDHDPMRWCQGDFNSLIWGTDYSRYVWLDIRQNYCSQCSTTWEGDK